MSRTAVVLFNLGGPDGPAAVKPFLFNLFSDPAIIGAPGPIRWALAKAMAARRAPVARAIYDELGGGSPLLANTEAQAAALRTALGGGGETETECFIAMRYWHPRAAETARAVAAYAPDRVVLLPLYPQYSTTTTGSSLREWSRAARAAGVEAPTTAVCCYPTTAGFAEAVAAQVRAALAEAGGAEGRRVLFSAHGLPERVVARGDPYQWQVEASCAAVAEAMGPEIGEWRLCYQSRVGPLQWIGPSTEAEIDRAGRDGKAVVLVPIAFVSEHSETLVELDIEYRKRADAAGVPHYVRAPTVGADATFIDGLAALVREALGRSAEGPALASASGGRLCPVRWRRCAVAQWGGEIEPWPGCPTSIPG